MRFPKIVLSTPIPGISEQLLKCTIWISGAIVVATLGYCIVEGWSVQDSFYMSTITFSTVGYGETRELSSIGRIYTSLLIFVSIILMSCWTAGITTAFVSGELTGKFQVKRTKKMIQKLSNHSIILGAGIMAESIANRLVRNQQPWVLIEEDSDKLAAFGKRFPEGLFLESNPKSELVLADANVFNAANVISILDSDFDNLLVAMSVKELNPKIKVITRSDDPRVSSRMLKAGVDKVICPFQLTGDHIADLLQTGDESEDSELAMASTADLPDPLADAFSAENLLQQKLL